MRLKSSQHFQLSEYPSGAFFILVERLDGADLDLFGKTIGLELPSGTSIEGAKMVAEFFTQNIVSISET